MGFCEIKDPPEFKTQVEKWDRDTMADGEQMGVVIEEIFNNTVHNYKAMRKKATVTLLASGWSTAAPYTQTVPIEGLTTEDNPILVLSLIHILNGVSSPANTDFKETENSKTWEAATVQLIAGEIAGKYGMSLVYEAGDIPVAKTEQNKQTDSKFLKGICDKYGLGLKVYSNRLVVWDYRQYFAKPVVATITPSMLSRYAYKSTMRGTYTGAKVSYTNPVSYTHLIQK